MTTPPIINNSDIVTSDGKKDGLENLSNDLKRKIYQVISVFETGSKTPNYSAISIYQDAKNGTERQVTFGFCQTTQEGNLQKLLQMYDKAENGAVSFGKYIEKAKDLSLVNDNLFLSMLGQSGKDPVMQKVQEAFFESVYFQPALKWAITNGFTLPLCLLIIFDSFIHSGKIRDDIRATFEESPPIIGGDEKEWIKKYVTAREIWLMDRSKLLAKTIYRTDCFQDCFLKNNWNLDKTINANGTQI